MADKRISQLIERTDIANNDVLPIVASGATTTNKVTISTIQEWMQDNLDVGVTSVGITIGSTGTDINVTGSPVTTSGNITINIPTASATNRGLLSSSDWSSFNSKLSSVGLTMPSAFTVSNSPLTANGTIAVTGAGTVAQYIRGDGSLADFPQGGGGGGASVSYYLNGSVSQGTIGGIAYREMNKTPIFGTGTDITINANGYIASFITDAGDPALLEIPAGNWNFETYLSASSGGGSPTFYIELYKVNSGGTATLIASNSATPELIAFGTNINPYFSALAVPQTTLLVTDRLALRYYVTPAGRTITLHTENSHLCQIITTFTTGLTALNGLTAQVQNFATGTSGTDFNISSTSATHTFNIPTASATNRGLLSSADWTTFNGKQNSITLTTSGTSGAATLVGSTLNIPNYSTGVANAYVPYVGAIGSVTLGYNALSASQINIDGNSPTGGSYLGFKHSTSVNSGTDGYTSIYTFGTNTIGFQSTSGGAIKTFSFSMVGITPNVAGGRVYTLPDASGTLALTSNLSGYLPLTGGTLTGALNGTSASFTGGITASQSVFTHASTPIRLNNSGGQYTQLDFLNNNTQKGAIWWDNTANSLNLWTGTTALSIASTGAATFSSSVTATGGAATPSIHARGGSDGSGGGKGNFRSSDAGGSNFYDFGRDNLTTGNFVLTSGGGSPLLSIASTGAATFSSSVTLNSRLLFSGTRTANINSDGSILYIGENNVSNILNVDLVNQRVGIGTASPAVRLSLGNQVAAQKFLMYDNNDNFKYGLGIQADEFRQFYPSNGSLTFGTISTSDGSTFTERMRITSGGSILFGTQTMSTTHAYFDNAGSSRMVLNLGSSVTTNANLIAFNNPNGNVGTIATSGSSTSYNTTSDYRLKENVNPVQNALSVLTQLKPCTFNFIADAEEEVMGFIAHEVQEIVPQAVTGEKDAVRIEQVEVSPAELDEEGNVITEAVIEEKEVPVYQGIDHSKLVPLLVASIQELKAEIEALKSQING